MKDQKYKIIFERFENYAKSINSLIVKDEYIKNVEETKSILDKDYLLAYYDIRFNIPNQNKILESIRQVQRENKKKRYNLLFIHLKDLNKKYYSDEKNTVIEEIKKLKNKFEKSNYFSDNSIINGEMYLYNDCLVFFVRNDKIRKFYKFAKQTMFSQKFFYWNIYFEELEKKQTKALKSFETCYLKTLNKIKNNQIDEKILELEKGVKNGTK